jgi:hypothetical protein
VDPATHPFDPGTAAAVILAADRPRDTSEDWVHAMSEALAVHYGQWTRGWRWSTGEGDLDGGPIDSWCCATHSVTTPEETRERVREALLEWREWLADLDELFDRFLPGRGNWEQAVKHLVYVVADRTRHESGWYGLCQTVLEWFLERAGVAADRREPLIRDAIGGRFESWHEPGPTAVAQVADRLAARLTDD